VCLNGAAARKILKGDMVIIMSFAYVEDKKARSYKPRVVYVNSKNEIIGEENHVSEDDQC